MQLSLMTKPEFILPITERLVLRRFTAADIDLLVELDSDPEVMRHISKGVATPRERFQNDILPRWFAFYPQSPPRGFWAAQLRATTEFVGWFHLRPDRWQPEEMELGYRLRRPAWGRGLATEGAAALVERALGEWGYPKVAARTLVGNAASQRVMSKAGLRWEADFTYPAEILPGWTEAERRGVKYARSHV